LNRRELLGIWLLADHLVQAPPQEWQPRPQPQPQRQPVHLQQRLERLGKPQQILLSLALVHQKPRKLVKPLPTPSLVVKWLTALA